MLDFSVTFIITIINIAVLSFLLRVILFKPVTKFMADRAKKVQDAMSVAEEDRLSAKKLLEQYQTAIQNAQDEADEIIRASRKKAEAEASRIVAEGQVAAQAEIDAANRQIETEWMAMHNRFKLEASALVMAASARFVQREFSGDDNNRYAAMLLDELAIKKGS
jgi:F-type H+-transporting ATPase subunit b